MRILGPVLLSVLVACSSSTAKKPTILQGREIPEASSSAVTAKVTPKGDLTLSTDTGDDLSWLRPIYFELDSSTLAEEARDTLVKLHAWLAKHPETTLTIEGHTDEQGTTEYNIGLGQRRAQAITDFLVRLGTDAARLVPISYGAERPALDGHDEVAWSKNRRGELRTTP